MYELPLFVFKNNLIHCMYKKLGIQFNISKRQEEVIYAYLTKLSSFLKRENPKFEVEKNAQRNYYRLPISPDQPEEFSCDLWLEAPERRVRIPIRDLSVNGCSALLSFKDERDYVEGREISLILKLSSIRLDLKASIRRVEEFKPSSQARSNLTKRYFNAKYEE